MPFAYIFVAFLFISSVVKQILEIWMKKYDHHWNSDHLKCRKGKLLLCWMKKLLFWQIIVTSELIRPLIVGKRRRNDTKKKSRQGG